MPYVSKAAKANIAAGQPPTSPGELNYVLTLAVRKYMFRNGEKGYQAINDVLGALEGCKQEFYWRVARGYENGAIERNGDVYE